MGRPKGRGKPKKDYNYYNPSSKFNCASHKCYSCANAFPSKCIKFIHPIARNKLKYLQFIKENWLDYEIIEMTVCNGFKDRVERLFQVLKCKNYKEDR